MARLAGTFLGDNAYGRGRNVQSLDIAVGGNNFGHLYDIGEYCSATPYIRQNMIAILIEAPTGFQQLPEPQKWVAALKALIELAPKSIEGMNAQLTPEYATTPVGGSGEEMETARDVKRAKSNPVFNYFDRYGRAISTFYNGWFTNLIMDPITKVPNVLTFSNAQVTDLLPDFTGCTVLFFEPDPTMQYVDKAWLCTAMQPKTLPPIEASRDINNMGDILDFSIEFTCLAQVGYGVDQFAQSVLESMALTGTNPNLQPAFIDQISADVAASTNGFAEQIAAAERSSIEV